MVADHPEIEQQAVQGHRQECDGRQFRGNARRGPLPGGKSPTQHHRGGHVERHAHERQCQGPGMHAGMMPTFARRAKDSCRHKGSPGC